jgi:lysozyme
VPRLVDVSNNNGRVDFKAVKAQGAAGVYLKVTEGTGFVDPYYVANRAAAKAASLRVGGYHFAHPKNDPATEAAFFLSHLKLEKGDLLPAFDIEVSDGVIGSRIHSFSRKFLAVVKAKIDANPVVYAGCFFMRDNGLLALPGPKWVAAYGSRPACRWDAWQYTDGQARYGANVDHLDTTNVPSLALLTYKAPRRKKVVGHVKRWIVIDGLRVLVGSREWKWLKRNRLLAVKK